MSKYSGQKAWKSDGFSFKSMRERCTHCHITLGFHGATPPHDRGSECPGFQLQPTDTGKDTKERPNE